MGKKKIWVNSFFYKILFTVNVNSVQYLDFTTKGDILGNLIATDKRGNPHYFFYFSMKAYVVGTH